MIALIVLVAAGVLSCVVRQTAIKCIDQKSVCHVSRNGEFIVVNPAALFPLTTERGHWYNLTWEEKVDNPPLAETLYYVDREDNEYIYQRAYRDASQEFFSRRVIFRAPTTQSHIRFLGSSDGSLRVRNVKLSLCPAWLGAIVVWWYAPILVICMWLGWILRRELAGMAQWMIRRYLHSGNTGRWVLFLIAASLTYGCGSLTIIIPMAKNNGWIEIGRVLWHAGGLPVGIVMIMYACGWPLTVFALQGARRCQCELLLSVGIGLVVLMCAYSFSMLGVRSHVLAVTIVTYIVLGWHTHLKQGMRPRAPSLVSMMVVLCAVIVTCIMMQAHRDQRDTWPNTIHNADISVYATESIALKEWSAQEICAMSYAQTEPTFLAYKADTIRGLPFSLKYVRVSDSTEHTVALLSWLLHASPHAVIGVYTCCMMPITLMAISGALMLLVPFRPTTAVATAVSLCTCFPLMYLQRDAFLNHMHGLVLMVMVILIVAATLRTSSYRWSMLGGLAAAALSMSFLMAVPLLIMMCGIVASVTFYREVKRHQYGACVRGIKLLVVLAVTNVAVAPHATFYALQDVWHGTFGPKLFLARPNYPNRMWTLLGGFVADWLQVPDMPWLVCWYHQVSIIATVCVVFALFLWMTTSTARRIRPLCCAFLGITMSAVLWSYYFDTSRYAYFKNLVNGAMFISVCVCITWATITLHHSQSYLCKGIRVLLYMWFAARLASFPVALTAVRPINYLNEKVASISEGAYLLPRNACIKIDVVDYIYTPLLHAYLRQFTLRSEHPVGYSTTTFPGTDETHILTAVPTKGMTAVWNNGYYWLYTKNNVTIAQPPNH